MVSRTIVLKDPDLASDLSGLCGLVTTTRAPSGAFFLEFNDSTQAETALGKLDTYTPKYTFYKLFFRLSKPIDDFDLESTLKSIFKVDTKVTLYKSGCSGWFVVDLYNIYSQLLKENVQIGDATLRFFPFRRKKVTKNPIENGQVHEASDAPASQ
jgi:hypothetical protein